MTFDQVSHNDTSMNDITSTYAGGDDDTNVHEDEVTVVNNEKTIVLIPEDLCTDSEDTCQTGLSPMTSIRISF